MIENNFNKICIFKAVILFNLLICSLNITCTKDLPVLKNNQCVSTCDKNEFISGECEIPDPILKTQWLNNIVTFENTNGKIFLNLNENKNILVFVTTLSNNKDRIFYAVKEGEQYLIKNSTDSSSVPYSQRKVPQTESSKITNLDLAIFPTNYNYLVLIGNDNSYIQIYKLDLFDEDPDSISPSSFFNENINIKGNCLCYAYTGNNLAYVTIATNEEDPSNYFLSFYLYVLTTQEKNLVPNLNSNFFRFNDIKGDYASCSTFYTITFISCLYINKNNELINTIFLKKDNIFEESTSLILEEYDETTIDTKRFFKVDVITRNLIILVYYSGESNNVPTFLFKSFSFDYQFSDVYNDNLLKVQLNRYNDLFFNKLEYNDLVINEGTLLYFVSTNEEKELITIVELNFFDNSGEKQLAIRYFIIELKKYYKMKILNGLKAVYFKSIMLSLAIDYCPDSSISKCDNNNGNAALIKLSYYYNKNEKIDFIDYAFNNNTKYVIIDIINDFVIENNFFGMKFETIYIDNEYDWNIDNAQYYFVNSGEDVFEKFIVEPEDPLVNVTFLSYNKISITMIFGFLLSGPENVDEYNKYCDYIDDTYGDANEEESYKKINSRSQINYYIDINKNLTTDDCLDFNCTLCLNEDRDYCIVCKDEYTIITNKNFLYGKKKFCEKDYKISGIYLEEFLNGEHKEENLSNEDINKLYEELKDYINNDYDGKNTIIKTGNVNVQISNIDSQKYSKELSNVDLGECGEILKDKYCKLENNSLIMLKFDIKPENEKSTYVQYEIYDPNSKQFLDLNECIDSNILINIPLELDSEIELLYNMLSNSGYNLFNSSDSFYNDICSTYTTSNNTDILLYDRRMDIYKSTVNISLCQAGCEFQSYDTESKKAKCNCQIKKKEENLDLDLSNIKFDKNEMLDEFYKTLDNSNFRVLKCYKLAFSFIIFKTNIGSIIMTVLLIIFLILSIINIVIGKNKINNIIQKIMKNKYIENKNEELEKEIKSEEKNNNTNEESNANQIKKNIDEFPNICETNNKTNSPKKKKRKKKKKLKNYVELNNNTENHHIQISNSINGNISPIKYNNINTDLKHAPNKRRPTKLNTHKNEIIVINQRKDNRSQSTKQNYTSKPLILDLSDKSNNESKNEKVQNNNNDIINNNEEYKPNNSIKNAIKIFQKKKSSFRYKSPVKNKRITIIDNNNSTSNLKNKLIIPQNCQKAEDIKLEEKKPKEEEIKKLNDEEMNSLKYEEALKLDKRTYFKYYLSLLFKKQLILFCFFPSDDYNVMSLKITLFLVSFSLYLTINGFFFNDKTMHKIYKDNGVYNILFQIPQILYSSIITSVINMLLKKLSLSEKEIIKIKQETTIKNTVDKSKSIEKCINIKFIIFFVFSLMLMLFFWYFISCFCAVYNNTQIILFKDTLFSFGLSMLYPFGLNLLPGFARIPSLRAENKDKNCLYKFSQILDLIL
mgnify:CR=1 FL=1